MESAFESFAFAIMAAGFVVGMSLWILIPLVVLRRMLARKTRPETKPETHEELLISDEQRGRHMTQQYIGVADCDPRNPAFAVWADREYDELFGKPTTAQQLHEKHRTILGWSFIALDWLAKPPTGQPQLTPAEAAWFQAQLASSFWRVQGTHHEEPRS